MTTLLSRRKYTITLFWAFYPLYGTKHYTHIVSMVHWGLFLFSYVRNNITCQFHNWLNIGVTFIELCLLHLCTLTDNVLRLKIPAVNDLQGILVIIRHSCISSVDLLNFKPVYWLLITPLCCVTGVLKLIHDFMSSLNIWVILAIQCDWEILRVILPSSRLIVNTMNLSSELIDWISYYLLVYYIASINYGLSPIFRISYTRCSTWQFPWFSGLRILQETCAHKK